MALLLALVGVIAPGTIVPVTAQPIAPTVAQSAPANEIDRLIQEGRRLFKEGSAESLRKAIDLFEKALQLSRVANAQDKQAFSLLVLGRISHDFGKTQKALDYYNQALPLLRAIGDQNGEAITLNNIGLGYSDLGEKQKSLDYYNQALPLLRAVGNRSVESTTLNNIGGVYDDLGEKQKALEYYNQALPLRRAEGDRSGEATTLNNIGLVYDALGEKQKALEYYNQALPLRRAEGDRSGEATTLTNIGLVYDALGEKQKALDYFNQAVPLWRVMGDRSGEATTLNNIGGVYSDLGEKQKALDYYNQALPLIRAVGDRSGEATTLNNIGQVYNDLGEKQKALDYYNQALPLRRAVGDRSGEATTLNNIGAVYDALGEKQKALDYYNQALPLRRAVGNRSGEATTLNNIGGVYDDLGEKQKALDYYNQALPMLRAVSDRSGEATTLNNIGSVYSDLGEKQKALDYYNQALPLRRAVGDRSGEATTLNNIGGVYSDLGEKQKALDYYNQALPILRAVGNRSREATTLNNMGSVYDDLGEKQKALDYYNQALPLRRAVGDRSGEAITLNNIGWLLRQDSPQAAIVFYKQSVNVYETLRQNIRKLPKATQKTYTDSIAVTYRRLADLLLENDRILEAQQVLDLLKVQEIEDYLRNTRSSDNAQLIILKPELEILQRYEQLQKNATEIGNRLAKLRQLNAKNALSPSQTQELAQLVQLETEINQQFNQFIDSEPIQTLLSQLTRTARQQNLNLEDLNTLRNNLNTLNAALIYPLILDDRLELIITTPNSPPLRRTVKNLTRTQLNQTITDFRRALQSPGDPQTTQKLAQQLYTWLIQPLEADLQAAKPNTLIYAPDGVLRYVPLATLHDGKQWLVQRYRINNIIARSLQELNTAPTRQPKVLAGAYGDEFHTIKVGNQSFSFSGIPFTIKEVDSLKTLLPTVPLIGTAFDRSSLLPQLNSYNIVHLATHGKFIVGDSEQSFIALGSGETIPLPEIQNLSMSNVDLVVLSACETGIGDVLGSGQEILGLGYQFQRAGARATIASLWPVDDGGTQVLMTAFYEALKRGMSKAQALQQAQQVLIAQKLTPQAMRQRAGARPLIDPSRIADSSHPYYWAPFILLGNGL
ncbi:tetratricopeptide repeat protein [Alkalinema sp. FACHB-956]|nr:tetratricopeptide repeat protein [Alkalinema sp. FACHB-956]